jgi:uncharacterized membrane protein
MTEVTSASQASRDLRLMALICYGLFLAAILNGLTAIVGVVLAYIKRADAIGTPYESHFDNLISVFWVSLAVGLLFFGALLWGILGIVFSVMAHYPMMMLVWLPFAWFGGVVFCVWYLYRTVKGLLRASDGKPYS